MCAIRNLLSTVFAIAFLVLGYCGLQQINAYDALFRAYDNLRVARNNGDNVEAQRLESQIPELRGKIDGNLKIYINFSMLSLVGIVLVERQYKEQGKRSG